MFSLKNLALHLQLSGTHCRYDATCVNHVTFGDFLLYWESTLLFVTILDRDPDDIPGRKLHKHPSSEFCRRKNMGSKPFWKRIQKKFLKFQKLLFYFSFFHQMKKTHRNWKSMGLEVQMRFCKGFGFFVYQGDGRQFGTFLLRYYITYLPLPCTVRHP